jgi:hypothetical protein
MSTYNLQIGWSGKDAAGGIISGDDFHTEFTAAKNAINDKAELAGSASQAFSALTAAAGTNTSQVATTAFVTAAAATSSYINDAAYPVGSVYIGVTSANPSILLGTGTWVAFGEGDVLVGYKSGDSDFGTAEGTGGAKTHTLTEAEMPEHKHLSPNKDCQSYGGVYGTGTGTVNTWCDTNGISTNNTGAPYGQPVGGDGAHNNLQPYITVYMWKRTA